VEAWAGGAAKASKVNPAFRRKQAEAHLNTTTGGLKEPLSLTLSPLRGARELTKRMVAVTRCAQQAGKEMNLFDFISDGMNEGAPGS
jgi:hypothetical protein